MDDPAQQPAQNPWDAVSSTVTPEQAQPVQQPQGVPPQPQSNPWDAVSSPVAPPDSTMDQIKSTASGLAQGLTGMVTGPADIAAQGIKYLGTHDPIDVGVDAYNKVHDTLTGDKTPPTDADVLEAKVPYQFGDITTQTQKAFGLDYDPQTNKGKYEQSVANFIPATVMAAENPKQIVGAMESALKMGISSEALAQFMDNHGMHEYAGYARVLGAVAGGGSPSVTQASTDLKSSLQQGAGITADNLKAGSQGLFDVATNSGASVKPAYVNTILGQAQGSSVTPKGVQNLQKAVGIGKNPLQTVIESLKKQYGNKPMTIDDIDGVDKTLTEVANQNINPKTGMLNTKGKEIYDFQQKFRAAFDSDNLPASAVNGDAKAFDALSQARKEWSQSLKLRDMESIVERAKMTDNPATSMKTQLRTLYNSVKKSKGYSAEEKQAIYEASQGHIIDFAKTMGSRLPQIGQFIAGHYGAMLGDAAASAGSRMLSSGLRESRINNVKDIITGNKTMPEQTAPSKLSTTRNGLISNIAQPHDEDSGDEEP